MLLDAAIARVKSAPSAARRSSSSTTLGTGYLGAFEDEASFLVLELYRVTEYQLDTPSGPLVLAYVTGDLTFPSWDNPAQRGPCDDCLDNDGDGLVDDEDPACADGGTAEAE